MRFANKNCKMISTSSKIGDNSQIGKNVTIGNYSTIEDDVVIGDNTIIANNVSILNGARIGENCFIHSGAILSGIPQDLKYNSEYTTLEIGSNNVIREYVTINKGTNSKKITKIGNYNLIMANTHIGHDCSIGDNCIIGFNVGIAGEVIIEDFVNISGLTGIHQFTRIGEHSMVTGLSRIIKDIPPYIMAAKAPLTYSGINVVGLKRKGFEQTKLNEIRGIYKIIFQQKRNTSLALDFIESNFKETIERDKIINFIKCSERGIIKGN
ncbi:acyl-ACP--UDP-N-acetylglucosamine O-acyltransferase [Algoriphagus sp. Y33]|uniref:acyl-ACP--UDP-N-acetylglucosamine O-acyltransferase n=1 Tax=Algoriphagus sp. Y33 TaxID=2772483 RepID=UPI001CE07254|nr:acyl-ACP--UDP-N-acetylglucosamine O-acyltransferase [Algoriphagus sp. Y33]